VEEQERFSKRIVRATRQHSLDCKTLLQLMGVPVLDVRASCVWFFSPPCLPSLY
jgi:hypothetical protein